MFKRRSLVHFFAILFKTFYAFLLICSNFLMLFCCFVQNFMVYKILSTNFFSVVSGVAAAAAEQQREAVSHQPVSGVPRGPGCSPEEP